MDSDDRNEHQSPIADMIAEFRTMPIEAQAEYLGFLSQLRTELEQMAAADELEDNEQ